MATGDGGCEAYTAIAWVVELSHERSDIAGEREFLFARRQHVQHRHARYCHPAQGHITCKRIASEAGRSRAWPRSAEYVGPHRQGEEPKPMMHGHEKSTPTAL